MQVLCTSVLHFSMSIKQAFDFLHDKSKYDSASDQLNFITSALARNCLSDSLAVEERRWALLLTPIT